MNKEQFLKVLSDDQLLLNLFSSTNPNKTLNIILKKNITVLRSELALVYCGLRTAFLFEFDLLNEKQAQSLFSPFKELLVVLFINDLTFVCNKQRLFSKLNLFQQSMTKKKNEKNEKRTDENDFLYDNIFFLNVSPKLAKPQLISEENEKMAILNGILSTINETVKKMNNSQKKSSSTNDVVVSENNQYLIGIVGFLLDFPSIYVISENFSSQSSSQQQQQMRKNESNDNNQNCLAMIPLDVLKLQLKSETLKCNSSFSYSVPVEFQLADKLSLISINFIEFGISSNELRSIWESKPILNRSQRTLQSVML